MVKEGDKIELEIIRITDDEKGVAYSEDGKLILIEGIREEDQLVKVEITRVFEETAFAKTISRIKTDTRNVVRKDVVDSPYSIDDGYDEED
mgnify:CR=1 FL=1